MSSVGIAFPDCRKPYLPPAGARAWGVPLNLLPEGEPPLDFAAARSAAASGAKIAADKAALVAHYFTGKDAEDQLKRFTNVQPQAESVKDEVWSRKAKATYKASASDEAGTKLRMNEYDSLSRALKGGAKQNNFGNNFKPKTAGKNIVNMYLPT